MIRGKMVPPSVLKKENKKERATEVVYFLMRHMGWGYRETMDLPIPAAMEILKMADRELREQQKAWSNKT